MTSHLREFIDQAEKIGLNCREFHDPAEVRNDIGKKLKTFESAMCFDMGSYENAIGIKIPSQSIRLPFKSCWFEYNIESEKKTIGILLYEAADWLEGFVFVKHKNLYNSTWCYDYKIRTKDIGIDGPIGVSDCVSDDFAQSAINNDFAMVRYFLFAINCNNVLAKENKPDEKLQKARAKRGKKPLFSYWTLELTDSKSEQGQNLGGSHASPRLHLRRGHPRQFKPGEWTWVQPCVVGNKKLGMVHKDYKFVPGEMAA